MEEQEKPMGQVIQIDEARIRDHLGAMVRGTVRFFSISRPTGISATYRPGRYSPPSRLHSPNLARALQAYLLQCPPSQC
ncbi:hypothetical protein SAMN02746095_03672 [Acidocella aminolytica 101 = DSM 11237]|nr:hypothetical protein SAMN02746095_03672 [Acidocella aminolytica 101 = DSM 11237]